MFDYLNNFYTAYLDNIIIYLEDLLKHKCHIQKVLKCLCQARLQVDIKKSEFCVIYIKFLGFIISTNNIKVDPEKVIVIKN